MPSKKPPKQSRFVLDYTSEANVINSKMSLPTYLIYKINNRCVSLPFHILKAHLDILGLENHYWKIMMYDLHLCMNRNRVVVWILLNCENEDISFERVKLPYWWSILV